MTDAPPSTGRRFTWPAWFTRRWQVLTLLLVLGLVALVVRLVGSRFGFPLLLHPDEWAVVDAVVDMARRNSFEPPWSYRPDHVEMKIDYVLFAGYAGVVKHMPIEAAFAQDAVPFYWIARLATVAFGVGSVVFAYLIGARTSRRLGLIMAALFVLFPAYVRHAHFATPDVPLTFSMLVLVYALMRYVRKPSWPSLLWASFAVSLGIAIKYPAAVGAVMIALVVAAAAWRDRRWTRLIVHGAGSVSAVLGFLFVISPTLFTNFSGVRNELVVQSAGERLGNPDLGLLGSLKFYAETYLDYAGLVLLLLGALGLVLVLRSRRLDRLPWFVGVLVWISLSTFPFVWERWGLPMWITPLLLAAVGVDYLFARFRSPRTAWIPYAAAALVGVQLVAGVATIDAGLVAGDTRAEALAYVDDHAITDANSMYEGYSPFLPRTPKTFFGQVRDAAGGGYTFRTKAGQPAEYAILSSVMYDRFFQDKKLVRQQEIYTWIREHGVLVSQFDPSRVPESSPLEPVAIARNLRFVKAMTDGGMSGPTIQIYRLPQAAS